MNAGLQPVARKPRECCNDEANLRRETVAKDRWIDHCTVCGARHFGMCVDPVPMGVVGGNL